MTARRIWLGLLLIIAVGVFAERFPQAYQALFAITGDALDWRLRKLSSSTMTNCGRVGLNEDPSRSTQCVIEANHEGNPFRVRYDMRGKDSDVARGLVRLPSGAVIELGFDGNPTGSGGTLPFRQVVFERKCPTSEPIVIDKHGRASCVSPSEEVR